MSNSIARVLGILAAVTLCVGGVVAPHAWGSGAMDEISNEVLNEGANPLQAQIEALVDYLSRNDIKLKHDYSSYWCVVEPEATEIKVSLRTLPLKSSERQMRAALQRLNLAYILNPQAHMAMSYPRAGNNSSKKQLAEKLEKLFLSYRLPEIWKPAVYSRYDKKSGIASLYSNEAILLDKSSPPNFEFRGLWKYEVDTKTWTKVQIQAQHTSIKPPEKRQIYSAAHDQKLLELSKNIGLYWAKWQEDDRAVGAFVYAGPILCNDVCLGTEPAGMVAVCVPFPDQARAMFVPDPKINCKE